MENEDFKKNEKLAQRVMDILINDYISKYETTDCKEENMKYLEILKWSIVDYKSCGFDMKVYEGYYRIIIKKKEKGENLVEKLNYDKRI